MAARVSNDSYYGYWAKFDRNIAPYVHLLPYHLLDVAAVYDSLLNHTPVLQRRICRLSQLSPDTIRALLRTLAVLHDLGKFSQIFQEQQPEARAILTDTPPTGLGGNTHHTALGQWLYSSVVRQALEDCHAVFSEDAMDTMRPLVNATFGHHGTPEQESGSIRHFRRATEHAKAFATEAANFLLPPIEIPESEQAFRALSWLHAGLMVVADWLGSNTRWFPYHAEQMPLETYWNEIALPRADRAVRESGIPAAPPHPKRDFTRLLPHLPANAGPSPLQSHALYDAIRSSGPQLHIFEDMTGGGKTEAALLCAHGLMTMSEADGFYIALPTMATANGMYARLAQSYRALFGSDKDSAQDSPISLILAHGARNLSDLFMSGVPDANAESAIDPQSDGRAYCATWLADSRKKALLSPCGVGTIDQALLAVLPARHQCLRLLGLARNVLVIDEVHAYDEYTGSLLQALLRFHAALGGSAILLSATLTRRIRQNLAAAFCEGAGYPAPTLNVDDFPLATTADSHGMRETAFPATRRSTIHVKLTADENAMYKALLETRAAGGCACWIRNTVDQAREAYERLREQHGVPEKDIILFHARFAMADRQHIEQRVLALFGKNSTQDDRRSKILVATQVVEQSLDLDFDQLNSDHAPMELLIQRGGRCHRHNRNRPRGLESPRMLVLAPQARNDAPQDWYASVLGKAQFVYPVQAPLWRAAKLLEKVKQLTLPDDARRLVESVYDDNEFAPESLQNADERYLAEALGKKDLARFNTLKLEAGYSVQALGRGWEDDECVVTRLGEETVQLRLLRWDGGQLNLWADGPGMAAACQRSEVRVKKGKVTPSALPPDVVAQLAALMKRMPDKGKWAVPLVLRKAGETWIGWAEQKVSYTSSQGLLFME
ncbi:metal dependent phosphohydrolase [Oleidesulfovibrio alaskensis G20]|uniref:Metal dependent phosphohydrolase n=1 Tax=Oleidesulfovibrio alaskensis (strain ATCC BAA-1058 / DSM 17464 / G20) TaxID=207559 RepID=Q314I0_OLEA2|nr:CRISPR-associated helicase/endonuclease Cas3 [Oleidesulfovibrio alaskensis]ABB37666.1 metal dependent phosphohydrolase [Oleidesulfovibrio alaskensis G20]